ncbi:glycosyltransferase [Longitalea luteola]|uniref:glycosyltransferase n=1 Tax=Longitalea luteola TaxID=2812563 RepID=UPI001A963E5E|nr:glycosyltransferase [Longitalea luteola]
MQVESIKTTRNVAIVYADAASGSRSAATALQKVLQSQQPHCRVRLVNITEIFDHHRLFGKLIRSSIHYFNWQLKRDRSFDLRGLINGTLFAHDLIGRNGIRKMAAFWQSFYPDVIVSVTPLFNPVLYRSAMEVNPGVQCITIPVNFNEVCSRYWFTPKVKQYYLNATEQLQQQAAKAGIPEQYRFRITGLPVDESAYEPAPADRHFQLRSIGLNPEWPVALISFGAQGSHKIRAVVHALAKQHRQLNLIILCGKNKRSFRKITALQLPLPTAVYSYLHQSPILFLHLSDLVIGKAGAMTISEALITQKPLIALRSRSMRPLQKAQEDWLTQTGTGLVAATPSKIAQAVTAVMTNETYKHNMQEHSHKAIYEAAAFIERIGKLNQVQRLRVNKMMS